MKTESENEKLSTEETVVDDREKEGRHTIIYDAVRRRHNSLFGAFPPKSRLKYSENSSGVMSTREFLYKYRERIARYRRVIKNLRNGDFALKFLNHLGALGLSDARISKYASHLPLRA